MAEIVAETERLVLRRVIEGDLDVWLEHMNTSAVMDKVGGVQSADKVAESFARMAAADGALSFALVALKSGGTLIGKCGLARIEERVATAALQGQVQIGWTLRADCWGRGYAREAADAVLAIAFERLGLATVYGQTSESNEASWRLMQRLGMRRCAELDYFDPDYSPRDNPTMIWRLDASDWRTRVAAEARRADA